MKLFVDDLRDPPDSTWIVARTGWQALHLIDLLDFTEISLDHDLASFIGYKEITGRDILNYLIQMKHDGKVVPSIVKVHSANVVGCQTMEEDIQTYWGG